MSAPAITSNVIRLQRIGSEVPSRKLSRSPSGEGFRDLLESVWSNTSEAMRVTDSEGRIAAVNNAYCRLVGMNAEEIVGKPFSIVYGESVGPEVILDKYRNRFHERAIQPEMNRKVQLHDGRELFAETTNSFVHGSNGESFVLTIIRDITARRLAEDALRKSELRFRSVTESATDAIISADGESRITTWNRSAQQMFGYDEAEVLGKPITELMPERFRELHRTGIERVQASAERRVIGKTAEFVGLRKSSEEFPIELSLGMNATAEGSGFTAIIRDITNRKRAEKTLRESERRYHEFFSNAVQGIFQSSVDGRLISANASLLSMLGYDSFEELASHDLTDMYVNPNDRQEVAMKLSENGSCSNLELTLKRKDGTIITVLENSRIVKDAEGNIVMFEGMLEDITERKRADAVRSEAQEELQHERNLLRILIDNLPDHIYFKDSAGHYVLNNRAHLRSIGVEHQEDVLGKTTFDFNPPELAKQYHQDELNIISTGNALHEKEEPALHKDTGEQRWHLTTKVPLLNSQGTVTGIVGISRDITEKKDLQVRVHDSLTALQASRESLAQLNNQKDRLFSVLSHDLRSPFTSILGFCEILLTEGEALSNTERSEFLTYIRDAAQRQLALLNRLLDWSRLETGRIKLDIQDIELNSLVKSCLTTHLGTAKQKEITMRSNLPSTSKVRGDQVLLMQVFNNLLSNSLKFTPKGGAISIGVAEEKEEEWVIAVKDTGRGIPKDDLKKLFKVEEKYTRPGLDGEQGTGLGLSLVYEIVRQHNGSIAVDSELDHGTTFTIRLPRVAENKEHVILVVDDDEGVRVLHSRFLKKIYPDAHVMQASNGKEAFALARQYKPRIIVTDYSMPEMNGYEFLNLLKGDPLTKPIPVFVITGKGSTASAETLMISGAAAVMDKPVASKTLQETIEKVLAEKI